MDDICRYPGCQKSAMWICQCKENYKFCKNHLKEHSDLAGCFYRTIDRARIISKVKSMQNALKRLDSESIQLAEIMISEINLILIENLAHTKERKQKIHNFILNKQNHEAEIIAGWANTLDLIHREKVEFIFNARSLLSITENSSREIGKISKLKNKIKVLKNSNKNFSDKIKDKEDEIDLLKNTCKKKQSEIELYIEKCQTFAKHVKRLSNDLELSQKNSQTYQTEINFLEIEAEDSKKYLEDAKIKIALLETNLTENEKILKEIQTMSIKNNSELTNKENHLKNANIKIKALEDELENLKRINSSFKVEKEEKKLENKQKNKGKLPSNLK